MKFVWKRISLGGPESIARLLGKWGRVVMPENKTEYLWFERHGGVTYVTYIARDTQRKVWCSFLVKRDANGVWHSYYAPVEGAVMARIGKNFATSDEARCWSETVWKLGAADQLWEASLP